MADPGQKTSVRQEAKDTRSRERSAKTAAGQGEREPRARFGWGRRGRSRTRRLARADEVGAGGTGDLEWRLADHGYDANRRAAGKQAAVPTHLTQIGPTGRAAPDLRSLDMSNHQEVP